MLRVLVFSLVFLSMVDVALADDGRAQRALIFDVRKLVSAQEDTGWKVDKYEFEDMMPDALLSICVVDEVVRKRALAVVEHNEKRLGGPLRAAIEGGKDPDDLSDLITATRVRDLLRLALARAPSECPVWMKREPDFRGVQSDAYRLTINLEAGGQAVAQRAGNENDVGAGGAGRLLFGYGLDHHYTLLFGGEFSGNALFQREGSTVNFPLQFIVAAPVVLRRHFLSFHHDLEAAPLVYFTDRDARLSYGVRVGGGIGLSTARIRGIMPWAGLALAFEFVFPNERRRAISAIKGGARIGFDWDF